MLEVANKPGNELLPVFMRECGQSCTDNYIGYLKAALDRGELLDVFKDKVIKGLEYLHVVR